MIILELSKCAMYEHRYTYVMKKYGHEKAKLMMTDTDSLLYQITTDDLYQDMEDDRHLFDFSNYDRDHLFYDTSNAKAPGLFIKMKQGECRSNNSSVCAAKCIQSRMDVWSNRVPQELCSP